VEANNNTQKHIAGKIKVLLFFPQEEEEDEGVRGFTPVKRGGESANKREREEREEGEKDYTFAFDLAASIDVTPVALGVSRELCCITDRTVHLVRCRFRPGWKFPSSIHSKTP